MLFITAIFIISALIHCSNADVASEPLPDDTLTNHDISSSPYSDLTPEEQEIFDHDAVAGSKKEARLLEQLSPEESRRRLAVLLKKIDTNNDNKISKQELKDWIVISLKNLDKENAREKLPERDEDGDNKIIWQEYLHKVYGYKDSEIKQLADSASSDMKIFLLLLNEEKEKFKLADVDKDGVLTEEEHVAFHTPSNYPHMAPYEIKRTLNDFDKNHDGSIDLDEFMGERTDKKEFMIEAEKQIFNNYDVNRDGKLNKEELIPWVMPGFDQIATHEMEHLFRETDTSRDGVLTPEEILARYESWVGSQATDYGRHLDTKEEL